MSDTGQGENLVVVYRAPDEVIANIIRGLLEGDSIPVVLESRMVPMYDGVFKAGEGYWGDVVVPEQFAQRSKELIDAYQPEDVEFDTDGSEESEEEPPV